MSTTNTARRKDHVLDVTALVTVLHDVRAYGARSATVRRIQQHAGRGGVTQTSIAALAAANTALVTDNGDGTFKLTDAGLVQARHHPRDRSWTTR